MLAAAHQPLDRRLPGTGAFRTLLGNIALARGDHQDWKRPRSTVDRGRPAPPPELPPERDAAVVTVAYPPNGHPQPLGVTCGDDAGLAFGGGGADHAEGGFADQPLGGFAACY